MSETEYHVLCLKARCISFLCELLAHVLNKFFCWLLILLGIYFYQFCSKEVTLFIC